MVPTVAVALLLLRRSDVPRRRRVLTRAALAGLLCAGASAVVYSSRGAGTGTQTAWGWPRFVYSRWESHENSERTEGLRWRGVLENAAFYGAVAALVGGLLVGRSDAPARS